MELITNIVIGTVQVIIGLALILAFYAIVIGLAFWIHPMLGKIAIAWLILCFISFIISLFQ